MLEEKTVCSEFGKTYYWVSRCGSGDALVFLPGRTGYPLEIIPGAAHNANVDAPTVVNEKIERFLAQMHGSV